MVHALQLISVLNDRESLDKSRISVIIIRLVSLTSNILASGADRGPYVHKEVQ